MAKFFFGQVVGVTDGDTLSVLSADHTEQRIRLHQIDAPELHGQDFGQKSKDSLSRLAFGREARIDIADKDKYGRLVGKVWVNGQDINLAQVKAGMAWVYRKYASDPAYFTAEDTAKRSRIGLWTQSNPTPPWEFRHPSTAGGQSTPSSSAECSIKKFCKQMASCEEARWYLTYCGLTKLDKDGDGTPCESLCVRKGR